MVSMATNYAILKNWGKRTDMLISQQHLILDYCTKLIPVHNNLILVNRCSSNLISILVNINENFRNER